MRTEPHTEENSAFGIIPPPRPQSPWRVQGVEVLPDYRLRVCFNDGLEGLVDMAGLVHSAAAGVFAALKDEQLFNQVFVRVGTVTWPGEIDLAPDAMYDAIKAHGEWVLR